MVDYLLFDTYRSSYFYCDYHIAWVYWIICITEYLFVSHAGSANLELDTLL